MEIATDIEPYRAGFIHKLPYALRGYTDRKRANVIQFI